MTSSDAQTPGALVQLEGVSLRAGSRTLVRDLDLALGAGERLVLVGGNGSGKSTLLHVLAGLRRPDAGRVQRPPTPPGMLFQDGALWAHMTVAQHLAFVDTADDSDWRHRLLDDFRLLALSDRRPESLSGGERLRLGLARALAGRPSWVLLDEPLSHLDPALGASVRELLPPLLDELGAACVTVTHEPDDVLLLGDRLLCLSGQGTWWLGPARFALESPPTSALAAFSDRGTILEALADERGVAHFDLGLSLAGCPPGQPVRAFLDAAAVRFGDATSTDAVARFVAPDRRGGSWVRVARLLLRCDDPAGPFRRGDQVPLRVVGRPRRLEPDDGVTIS